MNPSRRAALGALATVPVLALPVGVAMAAPAETAEQDAELFSLIDAERALAARIRAAEQIRDKAGIYPDRPKALIVTDNDRQSLRN